MALDTICIELTSRCPMRCVHCSACATPERSDRIDTDTLVRGLGCRPRFREIYLSGGEPFEHPSLEGIAAAAVARAERVVLYSSGATLSAGRLHPLDEDRLRCLARLGVARIDVSLYSAHAEYHDQITATPGSLAVTLDSCRRALRAGLSLGVHFVPLPGVDERLHEIDGLCRELPASLLHVLAPTQQGRGARISSSKLSETFLADLVALRKALPPYRIVMSSAIRVQLGLVERTLRDDWNAGFVDVHGRLHPSEGRRLPVWNTSTSAFSPRFDRPVLVP